MNAYYTSMFAISLVLAFVYAILYKKRFNTFITLIFAFVPIADSGYLFLSQATTVNEAIIGIKLSYIGGCFLNLFLVYTILDLCDINLRKWVRILLFLISTFSVCTSFTIGHSAIFYKEITGQLIDNHLVLNKVYGPFHSLYYIQLVIFMVICFSANIYSIKNKRTVSNRIIKLLVLCEFSSVACFFMVKLFSTKIDLIPLGYNCCLILLLLIIHRIALCDVTGSIIETIALNGDTGFISFNYEFEYLGSNALARKIFPDLNELKVDTQASKNPQINKEIISKIKEYIIQRVFI